MRARPVQGERATATATAVVVVVVTTTTATAVVVVAVTTTTDAVTEAWITSLLRARSPVSSFARTAAVGQSVERASARTECYDCVELLVMCGHGE